MEERAGQHIHHPTQTTLSQHTSYSPKRSSAGKNAWPDIGRIQRRWKCSTESWKGYPKGNPPTAGYRNLTGACFRCGTWPSQVTARTTTGTPGRGSGKWLNVEPGQSVAEVLDTGSGPSCSRDHQSEQPRKWRCTEPVSESSSFDSDNCTDANEPSTVDELWDETSVAADNSSTDEILVEEEPAAEDVRHPLVNVKTGDILC